MNELYFWIVSAVVAAVAVGTITKLWTDRDRLWQDELQDEDRLFAWRIVFFLIYPVFVGVDMRLTLGVTQLFGGYVKDASYALFSYVAAPQGIEPENQIIVLFAGVAIQLALGLSLLPSLLFRPHPFLATLIGYVIVAIFGINLVVDPILSLVGLGGSRWQAFFTVASDQQKLCVFAIYFLLAATFGFIVSRENTRLWFADLSRPVVAEKLRDALMQAKIEPNSAFNLARLSILYQRAGLFHQAKVNLNLLNSQEPGALCTLFANALTAYYERRYELARQSFIVAADNIQVDALLKGSLLAAAACASFAKGDMEGALNLSERALEFDDSSLVARMVKVDVFLRTGRKEQAGDEIIAAVRRGLDIDLDSKVPIDVDRAFLRIKRIQTEATKLRESSGVKDLLQL